jgi:hypothetical protein
MVVVGVAMTAWIVRVDAAGFWVKEKVVQRPRSLERCF